MNHKIYVLPNYNVCSYISLFISTNYRLTFHLTGMKSFETITAQQYSFYF